MLGRRWGWGTASLCDIGLVCSCWCCSVLVARAPTRYKFYNECSSIFCMNGLPASCISTVLNAKVMCSNPFAASQQLLSCQPNEERRIGIHEWRLSPCSIQVVSLSCFTSFLLLNGHASSLFDANCGVDFHCGCSAAPAVVCACMWFSSLHMHTDHVSYQRPRIQNPTSAN